MNHNCSDMLIEYLLALSQDGTSHCSDLANAALTIIYIVDHCLTDELEHGVLYVAAI